MLWTIPTVGYCLDAIGTIHNTVTGKTVHFRHRQQWDTPRACKNAYRSAVCITQHETWWDDNSHLFGKRLVRRLGMLRHRVGVVRYQHRHAGHRLHVLA